MQRLGNLPIGVYFIYNNTTYQRLTGEFMLSYIRVRNMATDTLEYLDCSTQVEVIV